MTIGNARLAMSGILTLALSLALPARGQDTEPGVWWEQTVEMSAQGMSMPATTQKVCVSKKGMSEPPGASKDEHCKVTDVKNVGPKMTWKMECGAPERMTGEGEITQGKNSYTGSMAMHSARGDMSMKMSGKLVGGDCDAGATRKQVAAIQKMQKEQQQQADQGMAQMCDKAVEDVQLQLFSGPLAMCKKPDQVARACARLDTREGFLAYQKQAEDPQVPRIAKELCKKDMDAVRARYCTQAAGEAQGESTPRATLDFLAAYCPDESRTVARKLCAGRSFTGMPAKLRGMCVQYAREELSKGNKGEPAPAEDSGDSTADEKPKSTKDQAKDQAKKVLKGLFGK